MKRNIVIATVAAAALIGGGTATALAVTGDDEAPTRQSSARAADAASVDVVRDEADDRDDATDADGSDDSAKAGSADVSAVEAIAAALRHTPGTAVSAELDDDQGAVVWDVDVLTKGDTWYSVRIDPGTGKVLGAHAEREDDTAEVRAALKGASATAEEAARAAAAKGTVTSVDLDDDARAAAWEAETRTSKGAEREWRVDLGTGAVTAGQSDD